MTSPENPLPEGTTITFKVGTLSGTGKIRGIAAMQQAFIGRTMIVEIVTGVGNNCYPYSCMTVPEAFIESVVE